MGKKKFEDMTTPEKRASFKKHFRVYLIMSVFFVCLNLFQSGGLGWAFWPILGWGLAVAMQGLSIYGPLKDDDELPAGELGEGYPPTRFPASEGQDDPLELKELERQPQRPTYREDDLV